MQPDRRAVNACTEAGNMRHRDQTLNSTVNRATIVLGALAMSSAGGTWFMVSRGAVKNESRTAVTQSREWSPIASRPATHVFAAHAVPAVIAQSEPVYTQNEFSADDAVVQRAASDYAVQAQDPAAREFVTTYRNLANRFAAEPGTQMGNELRTEILNHLSQSAVPAPMALQMECRQTICRVQLTGPEQNKTKIMEEIKAVGAFRKVIGMERPVDAGASISDVYLVMH